MRKFDSIYERKKSRVTEGMHRTVILETTSVTSQWKVDLNSNLFKVASTSKNFGSFFSKFLFHMDDRREDIGALKRSAFVFGTLACAQCSSKCVYCQKHSHQIARRIPLIFFCTVNFSYCLFQLFWTLKPGLGKFHLQVCLTSILK